MLFREGKKWKDQRTVLNKYLLRSSAITPYSGAINSACEDLLDKMRRIIFSTNIESAIIKPFFCSVQLVTGRLSILSDCFLPPQSDRILFPFLQIHLSSKKVLFRSFKTFIFCCLAAGCVLFGKRLGCLEEQGTNTEIAEFVNAIQTLLNVSEQLVFIPPNIAKGLKLPIWKEHCSAWETILRVGKYL